MTMYAPAPQQRHVANPDQASFFAPAPSDLTMDITRDQEGQVDDPGEEGTPDGALKEQEPASPPRASASEITDDLVALMQNASALLVDIAGPEPVHIEMSSRGPAKYYEVKRGLELEDARAHLAGKKTKGAMVRRPDGTTRALCYDADTEDDWLALREAAHFLASAGYVPLLEDSPAGRGGHLWIVYTDLVDARCAHRHVGELAPMLQEIREHWPGPGNHKVRLLAGRYVKPGFSQQCKLYDAIGGLLADNRQDAARALLAYQTPAAIVPVYPPAPEPDPRSPKWQPSSSKAFSQKQQEQACPTFQGPDARWQQKYNQYLWFQFTPQQLAAWYNEQHSIEELLPPEHNGMGLARWRGERTASVGYTRDGEGWVDFGASTRHANGKQDGGDALELEARISEQSKPETLRQVARDLIKEARAALETAAGSGQQPPAWVQEFMTLTGWTHYQELRGQVDEPTAITADQAPAIIDVQPARLFPNELPARDTGGLVGFHPHAPSGVPSGPYPPPARASYCCGSVVWIWQERKECYVCGHCQGR